MATEDEIIRQRLLFDGDGTGDERRIQNLLKTIVKWCHTDSTDEDRRVTYQRIISLLSHCEYASIKNHLAYEMNIKERNNYEKLFLEIEKNISEAQEEISTCKLELQKAKMIRKNRQEYDALAKVIEKHPDRKESQCEIENLKTELTSMEDTKEQLVRKLEMRQKQFHALIHSIHILQQILNDESSTADKNEDSSQMETS